MPERAYRTLGTYEHRQDAVRDMWKLRALGHHDVDFAETRRLDPVPRTRLPYVVIQWNPAPVSSSMKETTDG